MKVAEIEDFLRPLDTGDVVRAAVSEAVYEKQFQSSSIVLEYFTMQLIVVDV